MVIDLHTKRNSRSRPIRIGLQVLLVSALAARASPMRRYWVGTFANRLPGGGKHGRKACSAGNLTTSDVFIHLMTFSLRLWPSNVILSLLDRARHEWVASDQNGVLYLDERRLLHNELSALHRERERENEDIDLRPTPHYEPTDETFQCARTSFAI